MKIKLDRVAIETLIKECFKTDIFGEVEKVEVCIDLEIEDVFAEITFKEKIAEAMPLEQAKENS